MKTSGKYTAFVMLLFTIGVGFVSCLASASDKGSAPMVLRAEKKHIRFLRCRLGQSRLCRST